MIKCILSGKSLKQFFIISLISCFILLGNSFVKAEWRFYNVNEEFSVANATEFSNKVLSSSAGILQGGGMSVKPLIMVQGYLSSTHKTRYRSLFYWDTNNELNFLCNKSYSSNSGFYNLALYKFTNFVRFSGTGFQNYNPSIAGMTKNGEIISVNSFYNNSQLKGAMTRYAYGFNNGNENLSVTLQNVICFIYDDLGFSICAVGYCSNKTNYGDLFDQISIPSGATIDPVEFNTSLIGTSPRTTNVPNPSTGNTQITIGGGMDGYDYTKIDTGDLVYYFENNPYYRYDEGVCYIGTDDYDTLYSSGSTLGLFRANNGGTIFDLFSDKFGNSFSLNNVGAFINAWNINYFTWFKGGNRDENNIPLFNAYYTLSSGFYQDFSDDLIVPFIGNPIAYYFMGYVSSLYGEYATQGQSIATYCYYKLGLDKNSGGLDITDDTSKDYLNNASDFINQRNKFYGLNSGGINIQAQSWNGSILDYFTGGQDNYDFNSFFSSSFNKFKNVISLNPSDLGAGVLPTYIILFLMAIILFRFLSH